MMGIDKDKSLATKADELRRIAEEWLRAEKVADGPSITDEESRKLIHELQVHQIELEMQNEELRQTRDDLDATLEKFTDIYDFAPVGYFNLDRAGAIRTVNLTGADLLGVERSLLTNRRLGHFLSVETRPAFHDFLDKVFASKTRETCEAVILKQRHSPLFVQIEAVAFQSGEECRVAIIDISERKRMENELQQAHDALERKVAERTRDLAQTVESLRKEMAERLQVSEELRDKKRLLVLQSRQAAMGEMIDNIAHQWRQPLNTLSILVQSLSDTCHHGECNSEYMDETVEKIMNLIMHMSRTIEDFRNFSRPDQEMKQFDLKETVSKMLKLAGDSFKAQNIQVDMQAQEDLMVTGYPNEYSQVLLIILNNARDALTERKVASPRIEINLFREGGRAVATISDNAGGIPDEIINRIFDPYFTTKDAEKGSGIGLYISKAIIEKRLNGKISVRNTDQGAEFRIEV